MLYLYRFRSGKYGTKFIPQQYPKGFFGVELNKTETKELIAAAASMELSRRHRLASSDNFKFADSPSEMENHEFVAILGGPKGHAYKVQMLTEDEYMTIKVHPYGKEPSQKESDDVKLVTMDWTVGSPLAMMTLAKEVQENQEDALEERIHAVQYEGMSNHGGYLLRYLGSQQEVIIFSDSQYHLNHHMLAPEVKDVSKYVLCPMPGTLISLSKFSVNDIMGQ